MAILGSNEIFTRKMCNDISKAYGLPYDVVRLIVDSTSYYILHELSIKGREDRENNISNKFEIEIPMIGTIMISPLKYNDTSLIKVSKLNGNALRTKFKIKEKFLEKARNAYYLGDDLFLENAEKNFNKFVVGNYSKLISREYEED